MAICDSEIIHGILDNWKNLKKTKTTSLLKWAYEFFKPE
jgi:hypothetical protein